eukprot:m.464747 g.464747  ORF g.464747 m.464747 type:complete len:212 (+) comp23724_c0_seq1:582-1217(+)
MGAGSFRGAASGEFLVVPTSAGPDVSLSASSSDECDSSSSSLVSGELVRVKRGSPLDDLVLRLRNELDVSFAAERAFRLAMHSRSLIFDFLACMSADHGWLRSLGKSSDIKSSVPSSPHEAAPLPPPTADNRRETDSRVRGHFDARDNAPLTPSPPDRLRFIISTARTRVSLACWEHWAVTSVTRMEDHSLQSITVATSRVPIKRHSHNSN